MGDIAVQVDWFESQTSNQSGSIDLGNNGMTLEGFKRHAKTN
jgi:hypothetical protein